LADLVADGLLYPHKWWPISCRSSIGQAKFAGHRPTFYDSAMQPTKVCAMVARQLGDIRLGDRYWRHALDIRETRHLGEGFLHAYTLWSTKTEPFFTFSTTQSNL